MLPHVRVSQAATEAALCKCLSSSLWDCLTCLCCGHLAQAGRAGPDRRASCLEPLIMSPSGLFCLCVSVTVCLSVIHPSHHHHHHLHHPAPWFTPGCEGSQLGRGGGGGWRSRQRQKEGGREGEERREEEEEVEEDGSEVPTQFPCRHSGDQNVAENINSDRNLLQKCETPLPVLCAQQTP